MASSNTITPGTYRACDASVPRHCYAMRMLSDQINTTQAFKLTFPMFFLCCSVSAACIDISNPFRDDVAHMAGDWKKSLLSMLLLPAAAAFACFMLIVRYGHCIVCIVQRASLPCLPLSRFDPLSLWPATSPPRHERRNEAQIGLLVVTGCE